MSNILLIAKRYLNGDDNVSLQAAIDDIACAEREIVRLRRKRDHMRAALAMAIASDDR